MKSMSEMPYLLVRRWHIHSATSYRLDSMPKFPVMWRRSMKVGNKRAFDLETILRRLLMVGHNRQLQLSPIFQYELYTIPLSLIDEYGWIRKGNNSILPNHLGLKQVSAPAPHIVIVDMQQMLYHIVWPYGEDAYDLSKKIKYRLSCYCASTEQDLVFDRYDTLSAKGHEKCDMLLRVPQLTS